MAEFSLATLLITTPVSGSSLSNGDQLEIFWDDVVNNITVKKNGVSYTAGDQLGALSTNYNILYGVSSYGNGSATSSYSFCDTTILQWFSMQTVYPSFPYFEQQSVYDSPVCAVSDPGDNGPVCDIQFSGPPIIRNATDLTSLNGQVIVSASSSNGTVKYALFDFDYATQGQTSGTFTGLAPGKYTLYAKDANDCTARLDVNILFQPEYQEHLRFSWSSLQISGGVSHDSRVRIYEREYIGDLVEVDYGSETPFKLMKPKQGDVNDKLFPVHPTSATLSLISLKDYQFLPLFTQDNKKFKCVYEIDNGSGFLPVWTGFIIPSVYMEEFVRPPYAVEFQITDNVKSLKDELFVDDAGSLINGRLKLIKVISHIMHKTGIELDIRSGVNIFEVNHSSTNPVDDPLDQTYIDVACYREPDSTPFSCWDVLEKLLRPFGARILQEDNSWIIEEIDRATAEYAYRVFDSSGDYVSNSTFDPIIELKSATSINRAVFANMDQSMEIIPAYGKITIVSDLNFVGSLPSGGFEKKDLLSPESETFSLNPGVYISEEGFKDWTLRLNGTSGVSFGRVVLGTKGREGDITQVVKGEKGRSVGAFFFNPTAWDGNLRNAYIESAARPFQYGPSSMLNLSFDYASPADKQFEFIVLRFVLKLGTSYLQQNGNWSPDFSIYRAYPPPPSNAFDKFEFTAFLPQTDILVDTTVQMRIYYYAHPFFDYGLPSKTHSPSDGVDGLNDPDGLRTLPTRDVWHDYRADVRNEYTVNGTVRARRLFYELRVEIPTPAEVSSNNNIKRPLDWDATENPKYYQLLKNVQDNDEISNRNRGLDVKFYLDDVGFDEPHPDTETITLEISKYINENMVVSLYNFDVPHITNAKNMYNNFFRLASGDPTTTWARSGITEQLPLQQILLKVLGSNHSAPTFRITGSVQNEFARIGMHNYLKLVKPGSSLSPINTDFASNLNSWSQTGTGESFVWAAANSGSAEVTLSGVQDSKKLYQLITHRGGYIKITTNVHVIPTATNDREDVLWAVFFQGSSIIHAEKMKTFARPSSAFDVGLIHTAFVPGQVTAIGFFLKNINGTESCVYQFGEFTPAGIDIEEVYQIADYSSDDRSNEYFFELMQMSKTYLSLQGVDQGGNNQGGDTNGNSYNGAYSSAYGGGFDTILN
jgi:hypothetical protein